jgi:hypothetical protein
VKRLAAGLSVSILFGVVGAGPASAAETPVTMDTVKSEIAAAIAATRAVDHTSKRYLQYGDRSWTEYDSAFDTDSQLTDTTVHLEYSFGTSLGNFRNVNERFIIAPTGDCMTLISGPEDRGEFLKVGVQPPDAADLCEPTSVYWVRAFYDFNTVTTAELANIPRSPSKEVTADGSTVYALPTTTEGVQSTFTVTVKPDGTLLSTESNTVLNNGTRSVFTTSFAYGTPVVVAAAQPGTHYSSAQTTGVGNVLLMDDKILASVKKEQTLFKKTKRYNATTLTKKLKKQFKGAPSVKVSRSGKKVVIVYRNAYSYKGYLKYTLKKSGSRLLMTKYGKLAA